MKIEKPMTENQKLYGNMLYLFLMHNDVVTKEQMLEHLGWDSKKDRQLRDLLSLIGKKRPLISTSDSLDNSIPKIEKIKERELYEKCAKNLLKMSERKRNKCITQAFKQMQGD